MQRTGRSRGISSVVSFERLTKDANWTRVDDHLVQRHRYRKWKRQFICKNVQINTIEDYLEVLHIHPLIACFLCFCLPPVLLFPPLSDTFD